MFAGSGNNSCRQWMFAGFFQTGRKLQELFLTHAGRCHHSGQFRFAKGQGAGLVHYQGIDLAHGLDGLGVFEQHPHGGALAGGHHDGHGSGESQGARAGDDQHRDRDDQGIGQARLGAEIIPDCKGGYGNGNNHRHKVTGHLISQFLDRRSAALSIGHHLHYLGKEGVAANFFRPHSDCAGGIDRGADHLILRLFFYRNRFTRDHRFIHRAGTIDYSAVHRDLFARPDPEHIADLNVFQGNVYFAAVLIDLSCRFRSQPQERLDGGAGLAAGLEFHHLPQQDQGDDHRRRLVINTHTTIHTAHGGRKDFRKQGADHAVAIGHGHPEAYQGEHIETSIDHRLHGPHIKDPAGPKHHRGRQNQFQPSQNLRGCHVLDEVAARQHLPHGDKHQWHREDGAKDEALAHVIVFGIFFLCIKTDDAWFERHAAFRAGTGTFLNNFRMHGTGILGTGGWNFRGHGFEGHAAFWATSRIALDDFRMHWTGILSPDNRFFLHGLSCKTGFFSEKFARIYFEFFQAVVTAEIIIIPLIVIFGKGVRIFGAHTADRIRIVRLLIMMMAMLFFLLLASCLRHLTHLPWIIFKNINRLIVYNSCAASQTVSCSRRGASSGCTMELFCSAGQGDVLSMK